MKKMILNCLLLMMAASLTVAPVFASTQETATAADAGVAPEETGSDDAKDIIYQVALLQSLVQGYYDGIITVGELKEHGDTGIGTFEGVNGEMIVLDGVVYQALADGSIAIPSDDEKIPFSNVTFFDEDENVTLEGITDIDALKELLNEKLEGKLPNGFCVIRIDGKFKEMNVRSEYKQNEPYKPLAKVLETDQTFFDYSDIEGTVVGLYCPPYMDKLNAAGWHLHFISKDREKGGHVLGLNIDKADLALDYTRGFEMKLPENEMFDGFDLTIDQSEDIKEVETGE